MIAKILFYRSDWKLRFKESLKKGRITTDEPKIRINQVGPRFNEQN
jgi:hypothetical protein